MLIPVGIWELSGTGSGSWAGLFLLPTKDKHRSWKPLATNPGVELNVDFPCDNLAPLIACQSAQGRGLEERIFYSVLGWRSVRRLGRKPVLTPESSGMAAHLRLNRWGSTPCSATDFLDDLG